MLHEITQFVMKHWALVAGFIIVSILIMLEESRSQGGRSGKISSAIATHLINREDGLVVDVRDAAVFRDGHIVNAKNIPLVDIDRNQAKLLATHCNKPIILVDASGLKTPALLLRLKKAGFQRVFLLKGGMESWKLDNMPVTRK